MSELSKERIETLRNVWSAWPELVTLADMALQSLQQEEAMEDLSTHRQAWCDALTACLMRAAQQSLDGADGDDKAYWEHELRAFNRTFDALLEGK